MVIFMIRGGDGSVVDQSRRSPLHYAVEKGLTRIVQVIYYDDHEKQHLADNDDDLIDIYLQ